MDNLQERKLNKKDSFKDVFYAGLDMRVALTPDDAKRAVEAIGQYNYFEPEIIKELIDSIVAELDDYNFSSAYTNTISIGREGSPVMYVHLMKNPLNENEIDDDTVERILELAQKANADEVHYDPDNFKREFRFWWD